MAFFVWWGYKGQSLWCSHESQKMRPTKDRKKSHRNILWKSMLIIFKTEQKIDVRLPKLTGVDSVKARNNVHSFDYLWSEFIEYEIKHATLHIQILFTHLHIRRPSNRFLINKNENLLIMWRLYNFFVKREPLLSNSPMRKITASCLILFTHNWISKFELSQNYNVLQQWTYSSLYFLKLSFFS